MNPGTELQSVMIVMADGNIEDHERVKKAFRDCGINHVFTSVFNGAQLMDLLFKRGAYTGGDELKPSVIVMDIHLDLVDGFEALKQIKSNASTSEIPVYILAKEKRDADLKKAQDAGAIDYFKKPLKYDELREIVSRICSTCFRNINDKQSGGATG